MFRSFISGLPSILKEFLGSLVRGRRQVRGRLCPFQAIAVAVYLAHLSTFIEYSTAYFKVSTEFKIPVYLTKVCTLGLVWPKCCGCSKDTRPRKVSNFDEEAPAPTYTNGLLRAIRAIDQASAYRATTTGRSVSTLTSKSRHKRFPTQRVRQTLWNPMVSHIPKRGESTPHHLLLYD